MNELALFAGAGGGILGGILNGWRTRCAVEINPYCRRVLLQRQRDGILPRFPIWDDVQTFDGRPWAGSIDIVTGGFPCQDISAAGKGAGITGERSGLWSSMARIIGEVRPRFAFVENSPLLVGRGLAVVLGDLATLGYDARWCVLGADNAGAPHVRKRIWILAYADSLRELQPQRCEQDERGWVGNCGENVANSEPKGLERHRINARESEITESGSDGASICYAAVEGLSHTATEPMGEPKANAKFERSDWWATEPDVGRVANGVASRVDRLRAIGNGQVPGVVKLAWEILTEGL